MTDAATQFPYYYPINACFVVMNIVTNSNKTIQIFNYPIPRGFLRDIIKIPGISEADIRASLLKGTLRNKLIAGEIRVVCSDIDLLQFNAEQKAFLQAGGVINGLEVETTIGTLPYARREEIGLIGLRDGINRTFFTPEKFINGSYHSNVFHIEVHHNGRELYENIDYTIGESGGPATGYDTINFVSLTPSPQSLLFANYYVIN